MSAFRIGPDVRSFWPAGTSAGWRRLTLNHVGFAYVPLVSP